MQTNLQPEEEEGRRLRREIEVLRQECETLKNHDFYLLVEAMPQLVWVTGPQGGVTYINQRCSDYTGNAAQQVTEDQWLRFMHEDDQEGALVRWHTILDTGVPAAEGTALRLRNATGEYRWFLARTIPLRDAQNNIRKWVGTFTDIDEIKRAEEALCRKHQKKEAHMLQMYYQLKTRLRNLKRTTHILTEKLCKDHIQGGEDALTQMNVQLDALTKLIDDFLK